MAGRKEIPRELSIYINDKAVVNSFRGITSEISKTNNEIKNLNKNSETYNEDLARLKGNLNTLTEKQSEFKNEIRGTSEAMDEGTGSFAKFRDGLLSGDFESAKEGLMGIRGEMANLVKSSLAFVATPLGAAIAVLSGIVVGTKALFDFNQQAEKSAQLIENLSGKTGQVVEDIRIKMQSLTDTFGLTFEQLAGAVDNLVDNGVAKDELEALDKIKNGLLTAPDKNEFIASLESSALTAKQVGLSLEEVISLKEQIEAVGIDPEKTFGAFQKASAKLASQADSLRVKLTEAFGASFTDEILAQVKAGQITTVQALDLIGKKSKEVGLNQTQQAELSNELFGKAGLAAGGFATLTDAATQSLKKQKQELNANQKALDELEKANFKLVKAQSELFRVKDFGELWTKIKANAIDALADILTYLSDLKKDIQPLIDIVGVVLVVAFNYLKVAAVTAFNLIGGAVKVFFDTLKTGFFVIKSIITGDFKGAFSLIGDYFTGLGNTITNFFSKIKNSILSSLQSIVSSVAPLLEAIGLDVDAIQKKIESFKSKEIKISATSDDKTTKKTPEELAEEQRLLKEALDKQKALRDAARQKEEEARKKAAEKKRAEEEKAAKAEQDRLLALANAKANLAKAELNFFIANERSKLDNTKSLTPEIIAEETSRLDLIKDKQLDALAQDRLSKVEKAEADAKSAEELAILKYTIDLEYETQRQNLELEFQKTTDALKKQYVDEQKVLAAEQLAADNELALAEAQTKEEEDAIKRALDYDKKIAELKDFLKRGVITQKEYNSFVVALDKKKEEDIRLAKINSVAGQLQELGKLADASIAIFGQNKAAASALALINGGLAVTEILKTPSTFPEPAASISRAIQIAGAIATTAKSIAQINKADAPKRAKFFYGGFTGSTPSYGFDEYGPMTGIVHKNEYVIPEAMTQSPRYANTIAWLEAERTGKTARKFADGGATSPNVIPNEVLTENNSEMTSLLRAVLFRLENPVSPNLLIGYEDAKAIQDLNDERAASSQNANVNE